ncbi:uncharacterized protein LOC128881918 [Hylaeus volcanicus]|uniref:uncharacterized protein LOC128881918 n=1 Tax=Hylaeus volcanicus TaxID=313075 RepID=UPI0023B8327E|nr:uncharacterized protein LOC128881918 [Hylaeus volcanicus]
MLHSAVILIFTFVSCQGVPLTDLKNALKQNGLDAVITSECSHNEDCWEWIPVQQVPENIAIVPEEIPLPRIQIRREASNMDPNTIIESWSGNVPTADKRVQLSTVTKKSGNEMSKKDLARSRGAAGMPFSVLYMNQHSLRNNYASGTPQQQQQVEKTAETSVQSVSNPNYRIALRNGAPPHPRRHYSIIPQLFISYGLGPFGN